MAEKRCVWGDSHPLYVDYHDKEWGAPVHDDQKLFELLILEGAQAGLSWLTILKKRENYRKAFDDFQPALVAKYTPKKIEKLLQDEGIIRNRRKVESAVHNARIFMDVQKEFGSFDKYIWGFVNGKTIKNRFKNGGEIPAETDESRKMSKDLKKRGFKFVGPTICYAYMQSAGLVNDHVTSCFRYKQV